MNKTRKRFLLALILSTLLLTALLTANASEEFDVALEPMVKDILKDSGEYALFNLSITNQLSKIRYFKVYTKDTLEWGIDTDERGNVIKVFPKQSTSTIVKIRPIDKRKNLGQYEIALIVKSQATDEKIEKTATVGIVTTGPPRNYTPSVRVNVRVPETEIDPRDDLIVRVYVENMNPQHLSKVNIRLDSDLFNEEKVIELGSLEGKMQEFAIDLDDSLAPTSAYVLVSVIIPTDEKVYDWRQDPVSFEIEQYSSLKRDVDEKSGLLTKKRTITFSNDANIKKDAIIKIETNWFKNVFTSTFPKATIIKEGGKRYLSWDISLKAKSKDGLDSDTIRIYENYLPILITILIIILAILAYYRFRSPVIINKSYSEVRTKGEGISGMKIKIHVKNRTKGTLEDVKIIDKIPNIVEVSREFKIGTLRPSSILRHSKRATILKWEISSLEAFEERMITYKIMSKLSILGGLALPPAMITFRDTKGKQLINRSNRIMLTG